MNIALRKPLVVCFQPICFADAVLTFFIAGLLYLLCFKHVDNLGAYSIPSETGLLPRKHSLGGAGLKYHCMAEAFQPLHEVSLQAIRVESIEVTAT